MNWTNYLPTTPLWQSCDASRNDPALSPQIPVWRKTAFRTSGTGAFLRLWPPRRSSCRVRRLVGSQVCSVRQRQLLKTAFGMRSSWPRILKGCPRCFEIPLRSPHYRTTTNPGPQASGDWSSFNRATGREEQSACEVPPGRGNTRGGTPTRHPRTRYFASR